VGLRLKDVRDDALIFDVEAVTFERYLRRYARPNQTNSMRASSNVEKHNVFFKDFKLK
jgi:hypothetical protein